MTDKTQLTDMQLDDLFADVRSQDIAPDMDFMARLMADIDAVAAAPVAAPVQVRPSFMAALWAAMGGWIGSSGLVTAAAAGLWLGIAPPAALDSVSTAIWGESQSVPLFASEDILGLEG